MTPRPWRPPGLEQLAALGIELGAPGGALVEERVAWTPSHRIIASEYAGENLFDRLTSATAYDRLRDEITALREIADLTSPHAQHEAGRIELVRPEDRLFGPGAGLVMASFAYPARASRFSDGSAGTYYAARALETSVAETRYHEEITLRGSGPCVTEKTVIHAELDADLLDIRAGHPCPPGVYDPDEYGAGQAFGAMVRRLGGYGVVYDSVRHAGGECAAIFRPPALSGARAVRTMQYYWDGTRVFDVR